MQLRTRRAMRGLLAALADERRSQTMAGHRCEEIATEGTIQSVDPVNRELVLVVGQGQGGCASRSSREGVAGNDEGLELVTFHVALDCLIFLNRERVKMRMLQPMDRAAIHYTYGSEHLGYEHLVAHSISIDSELPSSDEERT